MLKIYQLNLITEIKLFHILNYGAEPLVFLFTGLRKINCIILE